MSPSPRGAEQGGEESVLILAPTAKDGALCRAVLAEAGVDCAVSRDVAELCKGVDRGAGVAVLSEEALTTDGLETLRRTIRRQPAWSDFPLLVLTQEGADSEVVLRTLETLGNVTLLERPVRVPALVSAVRTALRARRRQYQIRDYLSESNRVAESLREADRRKDEFLAILAHELRNPLAPLRNAVEAMRRVPNDGEALAWARGIIERQLSQMVRLIDDLLDLSRVSRGRIELRHEDVELASIVNGALEICGPAIEHGGHRLVLELPEEPIALRGDRTRLVQVVCNLLSNAAKYTPSGGRIQLAARRSHAGVEISVRDNGVGIPPDMLRKVFDMFTQVERSLERSQGGLGIGLTLVRRLVQLHGGSVEAKSAGLGQGAEFIVRLPEHAAPALPAPSEPEPQAMAQDRPRHRILIADDNRDAADSLAVMLSVVGHEVRTAYDGQQALELAETFTPDLALLDIGMPRMNGYDAARAIRARPFGHDMLLVALTGWGQPEDKQRSQLAGFDHHLVKPVDPSVLDRLLSTARLAPALAQAAEGK
jgi:signal transduction histidine kinase/ActR/RegA family two-component response regulator